MIKNFFLVAYRNLLKNKATTVLNISGLAIGVTVCLVIGIWLQRELSWLQNYNYRIGQQISSYLLVAMLVFCFAFLLIIAQCFKEAMAGPVKSLRTE